MSVPQQQSVCATYSTCSKFTSLVICLHPQTFVQQAPSLRSDLSKVTLSQNTYHSVDWRLDVEVGSRALRNEIKPFFVLALETEVRCRKQPRHVKLLSRDWFIYLSYFF